MSRTQVMIINYNESCVAIEWYADCIYVGFVFGVRYPDAMCTGERAARRIRIGYV
jgi:hypothetical protein